ncbi:MAG: glycosyltransferase family 1 protein [Methylacidiphilales bacterium]|nr:glycosyltransferase family 1 protein [Candidatus Methylacidiphilales bacterium]
MNVLYEGYVFDHSPRGGVSRYFHQLISGISLKAEARVTLLDNANCRDAALRWPNAKPCSYRWNRWMPGRLQMWREKRFLTGLAQAEINQIVHFTYYQTLRNVPFKEFHGCRVVTVHDCIHERFPETDPDGRLQKAKRAALDSADAIICISQSTRQDLSNYYPGLECKTRVVLHGTPQLPPLRKTDGVKSRPYFLYVGYRKGYKNFKLLARAFARFHAAYPETILKLAGQPFSTEEQAELAQAGLLEGMEHLGFLSEQDLAQLYSDALALVLTSRWEGFGFPILEAFACGTPVLASDIAPFREVAGNAALFFAENNEESLYLSLRKLAEENELREELKTLGRMRSPEFQLEKSIAATLAVYRELI